jgi:hypothetical protein
MIRPTHCLVEISAVGSGHAPPPLLLMRRGMTPEVPVKPQVISQYCVNRLQTGLMEVDEVVIGRA